MMSAENGRSCEGVYPLSHVGSRGSVRYCQNRRTGQPAHPVRSPWPPLVSWSQAKVDLEARGTHGAQTKTPPHMNEGVSRIVVMDVVEAPGRAEAYRAPPMPPIMPPIMPCIMLP